ncbi:aldo/keto reductase [Cohnella kolymensis]|uniref:Aldo/keto reductase n=1 Tax=Cohnella kolymensis TaxID=1590652 RepID=A0ABR5A688_9BACL|nr:aldo/keto reductase [Cohnella kolymensis]KIL35952.1 aldo/keto reductase [Cohnella kolymensis]
MSTTIPLNKHGFSASRLVLGCMGMGGGWNRNPLTADDLRQAHEAVDAALSIGINMFDHANIYAYGKAEQVFGQMLRERPELRRSIFLQSKCGIRFPEQEGKFTRFDFSQDHILSSVDDILSRLGTEKIDILLLHRPDPLVEPEQVAEAFRKLKSSGKVSRFGVSNMSAGQMKLLQAYLDEPLVANQLEMSLLKLDWLDAGVHVNQEAGKLSSFPEGTIEYCRLENVQLQAWSPLARGLLSGGDLTDASGTVRETAALIASMAENRGVTREAIVLSFLLRHPAQIQPVIGTVNPERIRACGDAEKVNLSHEEWYRLYVTSRGQPMP